MGLTIADARAEAERTVAALLAESPSYLVGPRAFGAVLDDPDPAECARTAVRWQTAVRLLGSGSTVRLLCGRCGKVVGRAVPGWSSWVPDLHVMTDPEWRPTGTRSPRSARASDAGLLRVTLACRCGARHTLSDRRLGERWMERVLRSARSQTSLVVGSGPYADSH